MISSTNSKSTGKKESSPPTTPIDEALQQYLGKQTKLQTAADAIFTKSFHNLDMDELDTVRRYREMKVFGDKGDTKAGTGPSNNDLVVADNVNIYEPTPNKGWPMAVAFLAAALAMMSFGFWAMSPQRLMPTPTTPAPGVDTDTQYGIRPLDGQ